ncbi:monofunctional biosynthetic peptidoglycan transglycosylase [Aurantibacillus circumpalustris]|uniref:monofunctional biosynthetic peptidoglycan transglycosylase n=1 Tax=Aurantibacillus circumpalustris TaxID=3036359 RepID=UPI00295B0CB6|nr:monofunctional biosynthetic peptidoglycan transglycosylase [Aurantibacillus circumpalustris]
MFILRKIFRILLRIVIAFLITTVGSTLLYKWLPVKITPLMLIRCLEQKKDGESMKLKHEWVVLDKISPKLQLAVVCSEDQNYLKHYGFDFGAIEKAMKANDEGKNIRGASTISQQTAKNVFLWPGRSYIRKAFEVYFTLLIESIWSKERIMEVYLNSIEMGKGVYGAEAAAQFWFKKSASKLNKDECAAIASILPNPRKFVANPASPYIAKRKEWVKKQMSFWGNQLDYNKYNDDDENDKNKPLKKKKE